MTEINSSLLLTSKDRVEAFSLPDKLPSQVYKQIKKSAEWHKATIDTWRNDLLGASTLIERRNDVD